MPLTVFDNWSQMIALYSKQWNDEAMWLLPHFDTDVTHRKSNDITAQWKRLWNTSTHQSQTIPTHSDQVQSGDLFFILEHVAYTYKNAVFNPHH